MVAIPVLLAYACIENRLVIAIIEVGAIVEDLFERFWHAADPEFTDITFKGSRAGAARTP